ncbi:hypothetical protein [Streptomyces sp. NPDC012616]|uniref:hypothetical protein n=1 Tax=Streptomyces sp. NPDC012616 TaxID=3364840 RepID=UPI0036E35E68
MSKNDPPGLTARSAASLPRRLSVGLAVPLALLIAGALLTAAPAQATDSAGPPPDWEQVQELATYNGAMQAFEDPEIGPVIIFASDYAADIDDLRHPDDWTDSAGNTPSSWPTPTTARSVLFTADDVQQITEAVYTQLAPDADQTYDVYTFYDGPTDRMIVSTDAPASLTDPLVNTYDGKITLMAPPA